MFIFLKSEIFSDAHPGAIGKPFREYLLIKSRNQNIFDVKFKLNRNLQTIPFTMMYMSGFATTRLCSGTSCSASLWYGNLSGIFGQLECKNLYDSDIRWPASPTVREHVRDENFVWCRSGLAPMECDRLKPRAIALTLPLLVGSACLIKPQWLRKYMASQAQDIGSSGKETPL